jgi:putative hydrolase of the HAD superfamily
MRSIRALWVDLDDTVFDHTYCVCRGLDAIREKYPAFGKSSTEELAVLYNHALNHVYADYLRREISFQEMRRRKLKFLYASLEIQGGEGPALDEFHSIYDAAYRIHRRAIPGSVEILKRFADSGMSLAILTNGDQDIQEEKLRVIGLEWAAPHLLTAQRAGTAKPHPQFYKWALEQTGHDPGNVLMVGDSLENDVEAALRCGLNAVLYAPGAAQPTISTRYGVAPVINRWASLLELMGDTRTHDATCGKPG